MTIEAILLGTAQDGGVPQVGCGCARCLAAWGDPGRRRWVACLGLIDRVAQHSWLIDATPDFREQLHALHDRAPDCPLTGILLTHAHVGHYAGLIHLGREAWNVRGMPVYLSSRMAGFLRQNAPWSQLVARGNIELRPIAPGVEFELSPGLQMTPLPVPHRDEFSDTLAFLVRGPGRRLLYCPDVDAWDDWQEDLRSFVGGMDVALLDGTFFRGDELAGPDAGEVAHPPVVDTAGRLAAVDCDVRMIHLNHTNPLCDSGPESEWLEARGIGVGRFGDRWRLD